MKHASPAATPAAPTERPGKTVPSSRTRWACTSLHTTHSFCIIRMMSVTHRHPRRVRLLRPGDARPRALAPGARARRARLGLARRPAGERARPAAERRTCRRSSRTTHALAAGAELVFCCLEHERAAALDARRRTPSSSISPARTGSRSPRSIRSGTASSTRGRGARRLELRDPGALPAARAR